VRPTEDIYLHLGGDGTYSLKPDLIPSGERERERESERGSHRALLINPLVVLYAPDSTRRNRAVSPPPRSPPISLRPSQPPVLRLYSSSIKRYIFARRAELSLSLYANNLDNTGVTGCNALIKNRWGLLGLERPALDDIALDAPR
jgi:hypothetical protein